MGSGSTHLCTQGQESPGHSLGNLARTHRGGPGHPSHRQMKGCLRGSREIHVFHSSEKFFKESLHNFLRPLRHGTKISSLTQCRVCIFPLEGGCVLRSITRGFCAEAQSRGTQQGLSQLQVPSPPHCTTQTP